MVNKLKLIGIDEWGKDVWLGLGVGLFLIFIRSVSPNLSIGLVPVPVSINEASSFFIKVIGAMAIEETFFRGVVFFGWQWAFRSNKLLGHWGTAAIVQAVGFMVYHLTVYGLGFQAAFVSAFIFGMAFMLLAKVTKNIVPGMVAHGLLNFQIWLMSRISFGA